MDQNLVDLVEARRATAREWFKNEPTTDEEIAEYYQNSEALPVELRVWHEGRGRASWTWQIVNVAKNTDRTSVVDIGCGWGYELEALLEAGLDCYGVEPNILMRGHVHEIGIPCWGNLSDAPIEKVDMILCLDVIEHLKDPDSMLNEITKRAQVGTIFFEHTPTDDLSDPLHPTSNFGWYVPDHIGPLWKYIADENCPIGVWRRI